MTTSEHPTFSILKTIPTYYSDRQVFDPYSFSKSPLKPSLLARKIAIDPKFDIIQSFDPVNVDQLKMAHDHNYIDGLMLGRLANGFGNKSLKEMHAIRHTVGNFMAASMAALANKQVAWSLTSGFHHACYDSAGGFCTIEGLTVTAVDLKIKALIVDEDAHFGNGCVDMIASNKRSREIKYLQSAHTHCEPDKVDLAAYRDELRGAIAKHNPHLIMYQAGADNWVCDPLGGSLTMEQMYRRDLITLEEARGAGIPIVVNLAGGYAEDYDDTLLIHMNTGEAMKEVFLGYGAALLPVDKEGVV